MRQQERIPLHDHSDRNSGGRVQVPAAPVQGGSGSHPDLSGVAADQHHAQTHAAAHQDAGADEISIAGLAGTPLDLTTHAGAADPHTGYVREADASWVDLTDSGATTLHSHAGGGGGGGPSAAAYSSGDVTVTGSLADITGCSISLAAGTYIIGAVFDTLVNNALNDRVFEGHLDSGGADQTNYGVLTALARVNDRIPVTQLWRLVLASTTTVKLRGKYSGGTTGDFTVKAQSVISAWGAGTSVASDGIWDAAGDLAVGTGADTAARLAIGAAGGALSRVNGAVAWNSGTAFPTAATGDRYWRTDLGMEFYYDGTRWLCTCPHVLKFGEQQALVPYSATTGARSAHPSLTLGIWALDFWMASFVATTNSGTQYWTVTLDNTATVLSTISNAANALVIESAAVNATIATGTTWLTLSITKVSTPGTAYLPANLSYRFIGT